MVAELRLDDSQYKRGLVNAEGEMGRSGSRIGAIAAGAGKAAAVGLGVLAAATVAVGASSVKLAADFDVTMRQVGAATGTPKEGLSELSALALKMGADTVFSAGDAGAAMLELAKGGISSAEISAGALSATLTLAAAGGLSMASSATYMSNALNTFGLSAKDGATVAAALAGGANASSASVESLGLALSQVGPGAKTAGLSIQETTAVLAAFDNAGIKGADSGTSLKTMLSRLVPQTEKTAGAMKELGLDFTRANGSFLSISEISEQLQRKLGKLTAEQQTTALATVFGSDATRAATVLMNEGAAGIGKYITATSDRAAADRMAAVGTEGAAGAMESLKGSVETVKIQIGTALLPVVIAVTLGLVKLTNRVGEMTPMLNGLVAGVTEFIAGLSMSRGETAAWGAGLEGAAARGTQVGTVLRTIVGAVREFAAGASMSRAETVSWGAGLEGSAAVGNRFGSVVRSVVEGVREFVAGLRTSKGESDAYGGALDGMAAVGLRVREAITSVFEAIRSGDVGELRDGFDGASTTAAGLTGGLQSLTGLLPSLGTLIGTAADVLKYLADHSSLLVDALPFLIGGFIAYKAAQSAANVAALLSLPIIAAQVVSNLALASANRALAIALGYQRTSLLATIAAQISSLALAVAQTAGYYAWRAALLVTQGATAAATAAQWLLNAALTANPIGLVIAGIALLVGILVVAYKNSETFRDGVDGAFRVVKETVGDAVGFMIQGFRGLLLVWLVVADGIVSGAAKALGWIPGLGPKLQEANRAFDSMKAGILGTLDDAAQKAFGFGEKAGGNVAAGVSKAGPQAFAAGRQVTDEMREGIRSGDAYGQGLSSGKAVGQGLVDGMDAYYKPVTTAASYLATSIKGALGGGLRIASPSKVTHEIGLFVGEGLRAGMLASVGGVSAGAGALALAAIPPGVTAPGITFPAGRGPRGGDGASAGQPGPAAGKTAGGFTYHVENMHVTQAPGEDLATALPREMANRAWELGF